MLSAGENILTKDRLASFLQPFPVSQDIFLRAIMGNVGEGRLKRALCHRSFADTVNSPLTDTLVSGQPYLRTSFQIPVLPPSQTLYLHIPVSGHSLISGRGHF